MERSRKNTLRRRKREITEKVDQEIPETDLAMHPEIETSLTDDDVSSQKESTLEADELSALRDIRQRASLIISRELDFH